MPMLIVHEEKLKGDTPGWDFMQKYCIAFAAAAMAETGNILHFAMAKVPNVYLKIFIMDIFF